MLEVLHVYILINFQYIFIECSISHLNVLNIDKKVITRKRQDTLDMCRIFNTETKKMNLNTLEEVLKSQQRSKRSLGSISVNPVLNDDDAQRVEKIVDKIYDDLQENGERVTYMTPRSNVLTTKATNNTARRSNFAPSLLVGPLSLEKSVKLVDVIDFGKVPRFKHGIIPYYIDSKTYDSDLSNIIIKAFDYIEKATCIRLQRLRERPTDMESLKNIIWLYITNPVGIRQCVHSNDHTDIKGVQMIVFGYDCMSLGDITHEIMHVLGFAHEHTRPDRDQYITVLWDNIKPGYKKYFEIINKPAVEDLPYDYASVLHYPSRAFSRNGQLTIVTESGVKIGQREGFSELDVEKISSRYSSECVKRNRQYLLKTCPTVIKADKLTQKKATAEEIAEYFKERLWPYGVVNFKLRDKMEFTAEERENINAVIRHIEKETCIEFRELTNFDLTPNEESSEKSDEDTEKGQIADPTEFSDTKHRRNLVDKHKIDDKEKSIKNMPENETTPSDLENEIKKTDDNNYNGARKDMKTGLRSKRASAVLSPSRRHANSIFVLSRSAEPGCICPPPGKPTGTVMLKINSDCFNSVNDLLHLFVHILGLDHQHNTHDRDSFLHIIWNQLTPDMKAEMKEKLPPAASVGFAYDYQSVMHYPWLQIKNGRTNIMYPIWNDGWSMGHWQGLSSTDVQKLNLLYFKQCTERRQYIEETKNKPKQ